jgi:hypothetical protein
LRSEEVTGSIPVAPPFESPDGRATVGLFGFVASEADWCLRVVRVPVPPQVAQPARFGVVAHLPKTSAGKLDRATSSTDVDGYTLVDNVGEI